MLKMDHISLIESGWTANALWSSSVRVRIILLFVNMFNNCWLLRVRIVPTMLLYNLKKILFLFLLIGQDRIEGLNQCDASLCIIFYDPQFVDSAPSLHEVIVCFPAAGIILQEVLLYIECHEELPWIGRYKVTQFFASHMLCVKLNTPESTVLFGFLQGCHGFHISGDQWIKNCVTDQCLTQVPEVIWETLHSCFSNRCVHCFICHQFLEQLQLSSMCWRGTLARVPSLQVHLHHRDVELLQTCKLMDRGVTLVWKVGGGVRVWDVWSLDSRILKDSGLKDSGLKYARKGVFLSVSFVTSY